MNEDTDRVLHALPITRLALKDTIPASAIISRLHELLSNRQVGNVEWRKAYSTNIRDFLDLMNATTPPAKCMCGQPGFL